MQATSDEVVAQRSSDSPMALGGNRQRSPRGPFLLPWSQMAPVVCFGHPTSLRAGDTWAWRISFADYPVSESWVLSYALTSSSSATQEPLDWDASWITDDGAEYTVTIPADTTDDFGKGSYRLTAFVTLSGARYSPYSAPLLVEADSASLAAGDGQSHAEKVLAAIQSKIENRVPDDVVSYQIAGRAINRMSSDELHKWLAKYRQLVYQERNRTTFGGPPTQVRF